MADVGMAKILAPRVNNRGPQTLYVTDADERHTYIQLGWLSVLSLREGLGPAFRQMKRNKCSSADGHLINAKRRLESEAGQLGPLLVEVVGREDRSRDNLASINRRWYCSKSSPRCPDANDCLPKTATYRCPIEP